MVEEQLPEKTTANYSNKPDAIFFCSIYNLVSILRELRQFIQREDIKASLKKGFLQNFSDHSQIHSDLLSH